MFKLLKGARGFTLMELLVVVGILGVLTAVVAPAVSGTKGTSQDGQVKSDGKAAQTAVDNYNNKSIDSRFPDTELTATHRYTSAFSAGAGRGLGVTLLDSKAISIGSLASTANDKRTGIKVLERTVLNFDAETDIYQADGSIGGASFVPDFLQKQADSLKLVADDTRKLDDNIFKEYLWVMKRASPGSEQEGRAVQVFRLVDAVCYSGGTLGADGSPQAGTVRKIAEDAFAAKDVAVKNAATALDTANTSLKAARKTRDDKQALLDTAQRTFNQLQAAGLSTGAAVAAVSGTDAHTVTVGGHDGTVSHVITAAVAESGQALAVTNAKAALRTAEGTTSPPTGLAGAIATQGTTQGAFDTALGALRDEQEAQVIIAKNAGAKCEGTNRAVSLTYQRVF